MQNLLLMKEMDDSQRLLFQNEINNKTKNPTTALLLTLFFGGIGAHRFYLGQTVSGLLYLFFVWTFVPSLIAFVELFLITGRVKKYNESIALQAASKIKSLS